MLKRKEKCSFKIWCEIVQQQQQQQQQINTAVLRVSFKEIFKKKNSCNR